MERRAVSNRVCVFAWSPNFGALAVAALALAAPLAYAAPGGGQITAGAGSISQTGVTTTITQQGQRLAIDWQNFGIAANEAVRFNQPGAASIALNRVLGQSPSQIFGSLSANGQVFILNPNGVLFGSGAQVNVGGLVASTMGLSNADFMAGNYRFGNNGNHASVVNQGNLTAANGGYIALLAPEARNEGVITATLGTVLLAAADKVTLNLNNGSLLSYTIDQGALNALAENKQLIRADGGQVIMTARAANQLATAAVNNTGIVEARSIQNQGGVIRLEGTGPGVVSVTGTLDASGMNAGESGGMIAVLGDKVGLFDGAKIDASGDAGGGTVLVGGNFQGKGPEKNASATFVSQGAQINAAALTNGNGGKVIVWADGSTRFSGAISAKGGNQSGDGGFVEVSGKKNLGFTGTVVTSAAHGKTGYLLLDPDNLYVGVNPNPTPAATVVADPFNPAATDGFNDYYVLASSLTTDNTYALLANNDVIFNANVSFGTTGANTVSVTALNNIQSTGFSVTTVGGALTLNAPTMSLGAINTNGGMLTIFNTGAASQSGVFAGSGGLTKNGGGTLTLSQANTYTGATTINAGVLSVTTLANGGVASGIGASGNVAANLVLDGGTLQYTGGSVNTDRNFTLSGAGRESFIDVAATNLTISGAGANNGGLLTKIGSGTLTLSGTNLYTGLTKVSAGTLAYGTNNAISSGAVTVSGGTLDIGVFSDTVGVVTLSSGAITGTTGVLTGSSYAMQSGTVSAILAGVNKALTKTTSGTVTLSGANTYTGATTISGGILSVSTLANGGLASNIGASGNAAANLVLNGGTLQYTGSGASTDRLFTLTNNGGTIDASGSGALNFTNAGSIAFSGTNARTLTLTGGNTGSNTLAAVLGDNSGATSLTKSGAGAWALSGTNIYTGVTAISAGRLVAANAAALGSMAGSTTVANSATLEIANAAIGNEAVTLNGTGVGGAGALTGTGTASLAGSVTLASTSSIGATAGNALALNGTIEGTGALDVQGGGTVTLGGTVGSSTALASFSGAAGTALVVNGGIVRTTGAQTYSGATSFGGATTLRTTAGGNVSAPGAVTATAGTLTLDSGAGNATFTNTGNDFSTVTVSSGNNVSLVDANALSIAGINATGLVDVRTQTGDLTLSTAAIATTSTSANAVTLIADVAATPNVTGSGGNFKNTGNVAITTGSGGAWRVYTGNPTGTARGGLAEAGKRYNTDDGSDPLASGNRIYFRIQPTLTLIADNKTKTYGDANPPFSYSSSGLIDGDSIAAAISSGPGYAVGGSTSTSGQLTALTLHNITPSAATATNLGYSVSYANGALTVNQKVLSLSGLTAGNKVYDGTTTASISSYGSLTGILGGETVTLNSGGASSAFADKNVGAGKTVNVSSLALAGADNANYSIANQATTADITARALTVTATNASKTYGQTATFAGTEFTSSGLQNGETIGRVSLASSGAASGAGVGGSPYALMPSAATGGSFNAGNYTLGYVNGTLTVAPAALNVTANAASSIYNGLAYSGGNGVTYSGFVNGESSTVLGGALAYGGSSQGAIGTGRYVITPSGLISGNYAITFLDGVLTINFATPTLAVAAMADGASLTPAYTGAVVAVTVSPVAAPSATSASAAPAPAVSIGISGVMQQAGNVTLVDGGVNLPASSPAGLDPDKIEP